MHVPTDLEGLDALELAADGRASRARRAWLATWPKVLALAVFLGGWQLLVELEWKPEHALPPPGDVFPVLGELASDGTLGTALRVTMTRALVGYAVALAIGMAVGVAIASSRVVRSAIGSLMTGLQTMPSVTWFPLAILFYGITETAITFVVALGAFPSIANGLVAGIDNVPPLLTRAGRVLGSRGVSAWRHVKLPAAFPFFLGGLKQGWAFAWRSLMAGELLIIVVGKASIGVLLQTGRDINDAELLLASMIVVLVVGIVVDAVLFGAVERAVRRRWGLVG